MSHDSADFPSQHGAVGARFPAAQPVRIELVKEKRDWVDSYGSLILRTAAVATGLTGVVLFTRSLRLFATFRTAAAIPQEFIESHVKLNGRVSLVAENGSLQVSHSPILRVPAVLASKRPKPSAVNVRLAGLDLMPGGVKYLHEKSAGKRCWFILVKRSAAGVQANAVDCEVFVRKAIPIFKTSLNRDLIRRGLARIPPLDDASHLSSLKTNAEYARLVQSLLTAEKWADRRGVGIWRRDSWAENLLSLPSQATAMLRETGPVRIARVMAARSVSSLRRMSETIENVEKTGERLAVQSVPKIRAVNNFLGKVWSTAAEIAGGIAGVARSSYKGLTGMAARVSSAQQSAASAFSAKKKS